MEDEIIIAPITTVTVIATTIAIIVTRHKS